jgi:hypothetical protein
MGGDEPFASSLGLLVLCLQNNGCFDDDVVLVDSNFAPKFVLSNGKVTLPSFISRNAHSSLGFLLWPWQAGYFSNLIGA